MDTKNDQPDPSQQPAVAEPTLSIDSSDVVKLILQFLKENHLLTTMQQLQKETGISLNTVDNLKSFETDIKLGRWDSVLNQVIALKLPMSKLTSLYEQIVFELLESGEKELAREMIKSVEPLSRLKHDQPERFMKLDTFCRQPYFNPTDAYEMGSSKDLRRQEIASELLAEVSNVEPSRLLSLLGQSLKYQQSIGILAPGMSFDLFQGHKKVAKKDTEESVVKREIDLLKGVKERQVQSLCFAPDGQSFSLAGQDGFLELWDTESLKCRYDLEYQQNNNFLHQGASVLCGTFSKDGDHIALGSSNGQVKIWRLSAGQCVKTFPQAHRDGILSISFAKDGTQLLTSSFDMTARIHGLKSGKTLKEFRGHTSFVNSSLYSRDNLQVITGSADGTVRVWDAKTTECMLNIRAGSLAAEVELIEIPIRKILSVPHQADLSLVCIRANKALLLNHSTGQVVMSYSAGKKKGSEFVSAAFSCQGRWLYCASEDRNIYVFDAKTGQLEDTVTIQTSSEVIDLVHHPFRNLIAVVTRDGHITITIA